MLKFVRLFLLGMLVLSTPLLSSCGHKTLVLHSIRNPVEGKDYYIIQNGDFCMTPWYLEKILQVKIDNKEVK
jgi:hypothetical protein